MSADNGIYIGSFPTASGEKEYRVIEAQAIENCDDSPHYTTEELTDATIVSYYGKSKVFTSLEDAHKEADCLYNETIQGYGICEYGIVLIEYPRPFPTMTSEEAKKIQDDFWRSKRKSG